MLAAQLLDANTHNFCEELQFNFSYVIRAKEAYQVPLLTQGMAHWEKKAEFRRNSPTLNEFWN